MGDVETGNNEAAALTSGEVQVEKASAYNGPSTSEAMSAAGMLILYYMMAVYDTNTQQIILPLCHVLFVLAEVGKEKKCVCIIY
jgi:hypothetical protein